MNDRHPDLAVPSSPVQVAGAEAAPLGVWDARSSRLVELCREYALFTHGAFMTRGRLPSDPVGEYLAACPDPEVDVAAIDLSERLFDGLDPDSGVWDHRLLAVRHAHWEPLRFFLHGVASADRAAGRFWRASLQVVQFADVRGGLVVPGGCVPWVSVTAFGLDGSDAQVSFSPYPGAPGSAPIRVYTQPPRAETRRLAEIALAGGSSMPEAFRSG